MTDLEFRIDMARLNASTQCKTYPYPHRYHEFHAGYDGHGLDAKPLISRFDCSEISAFNWRLEWELQHFNAAVAGAIERMALEEITNVRNKEAR